MRTKVTHQEFADIVKMHLDMGDKRPHQVWHEVEKKYPDVDENVIHDLCFSIVWGHSINIEDFVERD